jgi:hypothetical protein
VRGVRQTVFVTGEPGIGKTTLVDRIARAAAGVDDVWTARGQCVEHYGSGEAYLPVLEALGHLCRQPGGEQVITLLGRHAPTWLAQMPGLIGDVELETVERRVQGATRERMLRELAEALEALTAEGPWCWYSRICTGATTRRWIWFRCWRATNASAVLAGDLSARRCDRERASTEGNKAGAARA